MRVEQCNACYPGEIIYQINFMQEQKIIPEIVEHFHRNHLYIGLKDYILSVKETGITDIYNFCKDHIDIKDISFRISNDSEWRPFETFREILQLEWVDRIILQNLITCHYQPIIDSSGKVFAYELLARFIDENDSDSLLPPYKVFSAAKERGRLYALDRLCRMTAVRHAASIKEKAFINFIPTSIYSPEHCLQSTVTLAHELGINPNQFVFEVVETEEVEDIEHLKSILKFYSEKGFLYALDDVGEGFSTLEMLKEINPHYMKLDMKYVQGVSTDRNKQIMAEKFLSAGKKLGAVPLAEGIETKEDYEWLKEKGFQLFQGYLFGKPSPIPQKPQM